MTSRKKQDQETGTPSKEPKSDGAPRQAKAQDEARREADEKGSKPAAKGQGAGATEKKRVEGRTVAVVGIGTSAGGLKAMEGFFDHLPTGSGMAYVVIQHLAPHRESHLESLLQSHTSLPVRTAEDGMRVAPDTVYLKPPQSEVILQDGVLHLRDVMDDARVRHPIDEFFRSLARDGKESAVAVILSGAGSDGAAGIREINSASGLVIAQEEAQCDYPSMPRSAIETGLVDMVLPVEKMGEEIVRYQDHSDGIRREMKEQQTEKRLGRDILKVLAAVRNATGHDFSRYKRNTIRRRIERRLSLHRIEKISDYAHYIHQHPGEAQALFTDLLINVTGFFRDPEAFDLLCDELDRLLKDRPTDAPVRAWVPGCATGEEAYSLAMLLTESMDRLKKRFPVKIFATDINPASIDYAREGLYPESLVAELSDKRLHRFFVPHDKRYRVGAQLREMVVFAVHDITRDPPFSFLDLVSCRNLLIYMDSTLQRKVLPLLHYGLRPGGLLLLGTSEDVGEASELFAPIHRKWKIFRAREHPSGRTYNPLADIVGRERQLPSREDREAPRQPETTPGEGPVERRRHPKERGLREIVESTIMAEFAPPGIVVNEANEIIYFQGDTGMFLSPPQGEPRFELMRMVRGRLAEVLPGMLHRARKEKARQVREVLVTSGADRVLTELTVKPLPGAGTGSILITFEDRESREKGEEEVSDTRITSLQRELYSTRQDLQATIEEFETANEELQSANEELQANNEELQSTNEELETSREELQSTNEELETVNVELQKKNEELHQANDDITNLFGAIDIGTLILDTELRIQRYTPSATRCFRLIPSDIGRPLTDISTTLITDDLTERLRDVLETLELQSHEVQTREGLWYALHMLPYRTSENAIAGVVLTLTEVTELKKAQLASTEARLFADAILATIREPLLVLNEDLQVVNANRAFYARFEVNPKETEGIAIFDLGNRQWNIPELRRLLTEIIPENSRFEDFRVDHEFPGIGRRVLLLNARRMEVAERSSLILLAFEDITGRPGLETNP
jgi:two-component system CheB/CheR fusion protein